MAGIKQKGGNVINPVGGTIAGDLYGIYIYGAAGTVTNSGGITASEMYGRGVTLKLGGTLTNNAGGTIAGGQIGVLTYGGIVTNAGLITNDNGTSMAVSGVLADNAQVVNSGKIVATGGYHVAGVVLDRDATLTNSGSITASGLYSYGVYAYHNASSVTNAIGGTIDGLIGVEGYSYAKFQISNAGSIIGSDIGIRFGAKPCALINTGQITGAEGVYLFGRAGTVTNSGTITGTNGFAVKCTGIGPLTNNASGVIAGYVGVWELGSPGLLTNYGSITGLGNVNAVGNGSGVNFGDGGNVKNEKGGKIRGDGVAVNIYGALGRVANAGSIISSAHDGVSLAAGGFVTNEAGGSIQGANYGVYVSGGGTVTNAGTIMGKIFAIMFAGSGANSLTLETGSALDGAVFGSTAVGATNALILKGSGSAQVAFFNFETLSVQANGTWRLGGVFRFVATTVSTGALAVAGVLTTAISEAAPATVTIGVGGILRLNGASTLSGSISGVGRLAVTGGATTIGGGAKLTVDNWSIFGATARAILAETLFYAGAFTAGSGALLTISGGALTLGGTAAFAGTTIVGSQGLVVEANTAISGLTLGDAGGFTNQGFVTESGGSVTLGAGTSLTNAATGTWDLADTNGIALSPSAASSVTNFGLWLKTGAGVSHIAPAFANDGTVLIFAGALDFQGADTGAGVDEIVAATKLEFDAAVANGQMVDFKGAGGVLDLGSPTGFAGVMSGFDTVGSNDAVELLGSWSIFGSSDSSYQTTLTLMDGKAAASLVFDGFYDGASRFHAVVGSGHTTITYV